MRHTPGRVTSTLCALLIGWSAPARSQTSLATIVGDVRDSSGNVMPHVAVVLINEATGVRASLSTNDVGAFSGTSMQPGIYQIEASSPGFKAYLASHIELRTGQILRQDIVLQVGDVTQQVNVEGAIGAVELQRDSGEISSVLNFQTVKEMPSGTRKVLELVELTPGVTLAGRGSAQQQTLAFFSIAGNPGTRSNMYMVDGASTAFPRAQGDGGNLPAVNPPTEVIAEMRVISNSYSAEFGQGIGGVVLMTTKSGTNQLHGTGYYFGQNDKLNARNFFSQTVPPVRYNNYGVVVGGPIIKNRTFFLYNFERETNGSSTPVLLTLPTALQRAGNFSQTFDRTGNLVKIYDPATTQTDPATGQPTRQPFPGNLIPSSRFDPIASNLLNNYVPDANQPGTIAGANNFLANRRNVELDRNWHLARIDHQLTLSDKLYGRFSIDQPTYPQGGPYRGLKGQNADPFDVNVLQTGKTVGIGYTKVINPTTLSDFRFGYVAFNLDLQALGDQPDVWQKNTAGTLGLKNLSIDTFPYFAPAGYGAIGGSGGSFGGRQNLIYKTMRAFQFGETITRQQGRHSLRFGVEWKHSKAVYASRLWPSGQSTYDNRATAQPGDASTGNSIASLLLGQVASAAVQDTPAADMRTWYLGAFVQDDWRVSKNLTINLGARYEFDKPKVDVKEYQNFFDFTKINPVCNCPGTIVFSQNLWSVTQQNTALWNSQPYNLAPRVGFAWTPLGKEDLVIRGGYGIFFAGPEYSDTFWDGPQAGTGNVGNWTSDGLGLKPAFQLSQGFPSIPSQPLTDSWGAVPAGQAPIFSPRYWIPSRAPTYSEQANLGIQKQFGNNVLEIGYMGNATKHLPNRAYNPNELAPALRGPGNAQSRLPYPQFGIFQGFSDTSETSLYHSALLAFRRNFSKGLSLQSNYTFSRFLDNQSYKRSDYDRMVDYGPSPLERRHRFVLSAVYELPFGHNKDFLSHGWGSRVFGGWLAGTFINAQTGQPINFSNVTNTCNCFTSGTQGVNVNGPVRLMPNFDPHVTTWFDTSVFSTPAQYTFGNAGPGLAYAPGLFVVNLNLTRRFEFRERFAFEIRGEAFNLFNRTNFDPPNSSFGSPSFGIVTSAQPARVVQYAAKIQF